MRRLLNVLLIPFATIFIFHHWLRDFREDFTYLVLSFASVLILPRLITWIAFWIGLKMQSQMKAITTTLGVVAIVAFLPRLIEFLTTSLEVPIPMWMKDAFTLSPATIVQQLETWYQFTQAASDAEILSRTIVIGVVLTIYGLALLSIRFWCLRNADQLLGRSPEGVDVLEDDESDNASKNGD